MANLLWIRAKICEILIKQDDVHYATLVALFDPNERKDVIKVLAEMYHENHIWSSAGEIRWHHDETTGPCVGTMESLCSMITRYCANHGCEV
jgi:hypothetical protein